MIDKVKISIIIPVYNAGKHLVKCLDSMLSQTYHNIEVITVNDASKDNSLSILREYAHKDARIVVVDAPKNGGPAKARNLGLEKASGSYIMFVDSDDFTDTDMLERHWQHMEQDYDLVVSGMNTVFPDEDNRVEEMIPPDYIATNREGLAHVYTTLETTDLLLGPYNKLYKTSIIQGQKIDFPDLALGEDQCFVLAYLKSVKTIRLLNFASYHYIRHAAPTVSKGVQRPFKDLATFLSSKFTMKNEILASYLLPQETKEIFYRKNLIVYVSMIVAMYSPKFPIDTTTRKNELRKFRQEKLAEMFYNTDFGKRFNMLKVPICILPVPIADVVLKRFVAKHFEQV